MSEKCLEVITLSKRFGGLTALDRIDLYVNEAEIVGLIGPNGSGKTTLFNCITSFVKPDNGKIFLRTVEITNRSPHEIIQEGVSRTFQITRVFPELTVMENMLISISHKEESRIRSIYKGNNKAEIEKAWELLEFVGISNLSDEPGGELSYGQQKLLELASSLMQNPTVVLLDEPTAGVNPTLINKIIDRIMEANKQYGVTFFVIEHNMDVIMSISMRMYALAAGKIIAEGGPEGVRNNPDVLEAYLGGD
ncbi:MAG: ABC transporter ATP-binding protein [Deltaproteobacteria bacterium]|nr:MAG: ABC transporter ATP-binding protein [Deltaproteobacteria bacterium]